MIDFYRFYRNCQYRSKYRSFRSIRELNAIDSITTRANAIITLQFNVPAMFLRFFVSSSHINK